MANDKRTTRFSSTSAKTARARDLRRNMTKHEWRLWARLRSSQLGYSFRRQHPIGPFYADFFCAPLKLVVELDGGQHVAQVERDERRTAYLNERRVEVLRFWNSDVDENLDGVVEDIMHAMRRRAFELGKL